MEKAPHSPIRTAKAEKTRELIYSTALDLFARKGYSDTTLRDIAKEANVSLGLTYRYFESKEELLLELYSRLSEECAQEVRSLPSGPLASRFTAAITGTMDRLQPHRDALGSLFAVGLTANSEMAVLGDRAASVRRRMWDLFREVVSGSSDAPKDAQCEQLATLLYAAHLLIVLFWLQDKSEGQTRSRHLLAFLQKMLKRLRTAMRVPGVGGLLKELSGIIGPMFGPPTETFG
jgi:AcrR family transcriptional regulator